MCDIIEHKQQADKISHGILSSDEAARTSCFFSHKLIVYKYCCLTAHQDRDKPKELRVELENCAQKCMTFGNSLTAHDRRFRYLRIGGSTQR